MLVYWLRLLLVMLVWLVGCRALAQQIKAGEIPLDAWVFSEADVQNLGNTHELKGEWEYRWGLCSPTSGDSGIPPCALPDHRDGWQTISGSPEPPAPSELQEYLWLRTRLPTDLQVAFPAMLLEGITYTAEVYIDGVLLRSYGGVGMPKWADTNVLSLFSLPEDYGGRVLTLRVYAPVIPFLSDVLTNPVRLGAATIGSSVTLVRQVVVGDVGRIVVATITTFIGLVQLVMFLLHMRRHRAIFLGSGCFAVVMGLYMFTRTSLPAFMGWSPQGWRYCELLLLYPAAALYGVFILQTISSRVPKILWWMLVLIVALILFSALLGVWLAVSNMFPVAYILRAWQFCVLFAVVISLIVFVWDSFLGNLEARILLAGFFLFSFVAALDVFNAMGVIDLWHGASVTHWGLLAVILAISLVLARRFDVVYRAQILLSRTLRRVLEGTREMGSLQERNAIARVGVMRIAEEFVELPSIEGDVFFVLRDGHDALGGMAILRNGVAVDPLAVAVTSRPPAVVRRDSAWVEAGDLWIPLQQNDEFIGLARVGPVADESLDENRLRAINLHAQSIALSIQNAEFLESIREAHRREIETERRGLIERVGMVADISDKLNSPLLVALNTCDQLEGKLKVFHDSGSTEPLVQAWEKYFPHLKHSLESIQNLSGQLSALREGDGLCESTEAMRGNV